MAAWAVSFWLGRLILEIRSISVPITGIELMLNIVEYVPILGNQTVDFWEKVLRRESVVKLLFCNKFKQLKLCVQCYYRYFILTKRKKLFLLTEKILSTIYIMGWCCAHSFRTMKRKHDETLKKSSNLSLIVIRVKKSLFDFRQWKLSFGWKFSKQFTSKSSVQTIAQVKLVKFQLWNWK